MKKNNELSNVLNIIKNVRIETSKLKDKLGKMGPEFTGEINWPVTITINKGLEGAIATETKVGYVDGLNGHLIYRGYDVMELCEYSSFEEVSYLLLFGKLPKKQELAKFKKQLLNYRFLPKKVINVLKSIDIKNTHPMISLYIGVSILATLNKNTSDTSIENETEIAIELIARLPLIVGVIARLRANKKIIHPSSSLSHAGNFLYMITGKKPTPAQEKIMDVAMILHADHGLNASTFTSMVINSTLSDMYSSIVGGIASLKGPLHGGANERVLLNVFNEIKDPDNVEEWFRKTREARKKIMGFGHRVYRTYDPRARILGPLAEYLCQKDKEMNNLYMIAKKLEEVAVNELGKTKKIFPNVDYYSGLVYKALGIDIPMFTPIFAASRVSGWAARILEYLPNNRIFRPRSIYVDKLHKKYKPIDKR